MKKFKFLFAIVAMLMLIPFGVLAEEASSGDESKDKQVNLYFFNGNGCGHCANAEAWFEEIEDEYGKYFNLVSYEVWYNEDNNELMQKVAKLRKEEVDGVPYIVVGNQSWGGFSESYKEEIITKIKAEYELEPTERYDIMNYVNSIKEEKESYGDDILALILILVVTGAVVTGVIIARKKSN